MGMAPHIKCCGCCCTLHMGAMIGTVLYALLMVIFLCMGFAWQSRGIKQPAAFCKGTTAAYRFGDDVNSALTTSIALHPSITLPCWTRRSAQPAPASVSRLDAQASTSAMAKTSAPAPTGTKCRRMLMRATCLATSCKF